MNSVVEMTLAENVIAVIDLNYTFSFDAKFKNNIINIFCNRLNKKSIAL